MNALHQRPVKHFLDDILADELIQKEGIEWRISGHFLKQRIIVIVVGFACEYFSHLFFDISVSVRCQKEEGKSVPFHEYAGKGTDSLHSHLINHHHDAWIAGCDELKIKISVKNAREAVWAYREKNPSTGVPEDTLSTDNRNREFSRETFLDAIMTFVVGDDQVSFLSLVCL